MATLPETDNRLTGKHKKQHYGHAATDAVYLFQSS